MVDYKSVIVVDSTIKTSDYAEIYRLYFDLDKGTQVELRMYHSRHPAIRGIMKGLKKIYNVNMMDQTFIINDVPFDDCWVLKVMGLYGIFAILDYNKLEDIFDDTIRKSKSVRRHNNIILDSIIVESPVPNSFNSAKHAMDLFLAKKDDIIFSEDSIEGDDMDSKNDSV